MKTNYSVGQKLNRIDNRDDGLCNRAEAVAVTPDSVTLQWESCDWWNEYFYTDSGDMLLLSEMKSVESPWAEMVGPCGADAAADFSSPNDLSANL